MRTLAPSKAFLRVSDKFFGRHVLLDRELKPGATLLYLYLYAMCRDKDCCWPSQATMAAACKATERSVQDYLKELVRLEYIRVERQGTRNVYRLLCSERAMEMATLAGMEPHHDIYENISPIEERETKISVRKGEKISYDLRSLNKEINTPLSPLSQTTPPSGTASCRGCSPRSPLSGSGRGESRRPARAKAALRDFPTEFSQLWQAWPLHQDRCEAFQEYVRQGKSGQLPALPELLATVNHLKAEDRRWQNGYIPNLKFWLRGRRWDDEPFSGVQACRPEAVAAPAPVERHVVEPVTRVRPEFEAAAGKLRAMWPQIPDGVIKAALVVSNVNLSSIGVRLGSLGARLRTPDPNPRAVGQWLREAVA